MGIFKEAKRDWDMEVQREAARLVEEGTPPYVAIERAANTIERKRLKKAFEKAHS